MKHRVFSLCQTCGRDIARWEDGWVTSVGGNGWWHLDGDIPIDHEAEPGPVVRP